MVRNPASLPRLERDLTEPEPIPEAAIARANALMRSGRLFRYGELGADQNDVALLEEEFARFVGRRFCVAVNSGGAALTLALKVLDVAADEPVLVNGFTLAPVPGAIVHAGGRPVLVEIGADYVIDCEDLRRKARASGARILLLSHMRGHIADMDEVLRACDELGLLLVEDCAHALCAAWKGRALGRFGVAAAFSAQTYKHLNAGEGGLLVLDDPDRAARAIIHSGSYMLHGQHRSAPPAETFAPWEETTPNFSMRMTALAGALLRPQLADLPRRAARWREIHDRIGTGIGRSQHVRLPRRLPEATYAPTSVQFSLQGLGEAEILAVLERCAARGLPIKWFGAQRRAGFTSGPRHWRYAGAQRPMPQTERVLSGLCDIRTPLSLTDPDCDLVAEIVREAIETVASASAEAAARRPAATA